MVAPQSTAAVPNVSGMGSQDHSGPCAFANVPQLGHEELNRWRLVPVMLPCSFQTASAPHGCARPEDFAPCGRSPSQGAF